MNQTDFRRPRFLPAGFEARGWLLLLPFLALSVARLGGRGRQLRALLAGSPLPVPVENEPNLSTSD